MPQRDNFVSCPTSNNHKSARSVNCTYFAQNATPSCSRHPRLWSRSRFRTPSSPIQLRQSTSAFASAGGNSKGYLNISALRVAMIMVLGRAVKESEAESLLLAIEKRSFPGQHKVRQRVNSTKNLRDYLIQTVAR